MEENVECRYVTNTIINLKKHDSKKHLTKLLVKSTNNYNINNVCTTYEHNENMDNYNNMNIIESQNLII